MNYVPTCTCVYVHIYDLLPLVTIEFEGSATNYNWNTAFHVVLPSGAGTVTSTVDSIDVTLTFGTYEFRVRSVGDFLCVTLVDGDVDILDGLMGTIYFHKTKKHTPYTWIYTLLQWFKFCVMFNVAGYAYYYCIDCAF